jgi:hypothetical protein
MIHYTARYKIKVKGYGRMAFEDILFSGRNIIGYFIGLCVYLFLDNSGVTTILCVILGIFALVLVVNFIIYLDKRNMGQENAYPTLAVVKDRMGVEYQNEFKQEISSIPEIYKKD